MTSNTHTNTEASAVQVSRTHAERVKDKLNGDYTPIAYRNLIKIMEDLDVADALIILRAATKLYELRMEEVKKGIY
jgi:hypothetical protein